MLKTKMIALQTATSIPSASSGPTTPEKITAQCSPPSSSWMTSVTPDLVKKKEQHNLKLALCGGERLSPNR